MMEVLCIYHADCADGLLAAWAVKKALGDQVEFVAAKYGYTPYMDGTFHDISYVGKDVLIVDLSMPLDLLRAMAQEARSVLVLDHHKMAKKDLAPLGRLELSFQEWLKRPDLVDKNLSRGSDIWLAAIFDLSRSGAGITWDCLHPGKPRPRIIDLVEDRDLWKFKFGDETRAFHAVLASYDWNDREAIFEQLDFWNACSVETPTIANGRIQWRYTLAEGSAILRAHCQAVASAVAATRRTIKIAGHVVPCANVPPSMASDAGHLLCQAEVRGSWIEPSGHYVESGIQPPFSATYHDSSDGKRHFSLRSPEGGADVGKIAKQMAERFNNLDGFISSDSDGMQKLLVGRPWSGGGHARAAGFDAPLGWEGE